MLMMIYIDRTEQLFQVSNGSFFAGLLGNNPLDVSVHFKNAIGHMVTMGFIGAGAR